MYSTICRGCISRQGCRGLILNITELVVSSVFNPWSTPFPRHHATVSWVFLLRSSIKLPSSTSSMVNSFPLRLLRLHHVCLRLAPYTTTVRASLGPSCNDSRTPPPPPPPPPPSGWSSTNTMIQQVPTVCTNSSAQVPTVCTNSSAEHAGTHQSHLKTLTEAPQLCEPPGARFKANSPLEPPPHVTPATSDISSEILAVIGPRRTQALRPSCAHGAASARIAANPSPGSSHRGIGCANACDHIDTENTKYTQMSSDVTPTPRGVEARLERPPLKLARRSHLCRSTLVHEGAASRVHSGIHESAASLNTRRESKRSNHGRARASALRRHRTCCANACRNKADKSRQMSSRRAFT